MKRKELKKEYTKVVYQCENCGAEHTSESSIYKCEVCGSEYCSNCGAMGEYVIWPPEVVTKENLKACGITGWFDDLASWSQAIRLCPKCNETKRPKYDKQLEEIVETFRQSLEQWNKSIVKDKKIKRRL